MMAVLHKEGGIKKKVTVVKQAVMFHMQQLGLYLHQKTKDSAYTAGWPGRISWRRVQEAASCSKRWINGIARFALLRWTI